ncbi:hypothetical protein LWC34_27680 [Kibdelosporangium philippinense]|uniref:AAA domain-containing protein n=1 Tax=Kibdelosporangium philippinense TaxID=211113 RepID=A0ABS8ZLB0_9PSEU|nr:hypothetical protein [Kibdelosporangium philippinense]MCE7006582.1 hypothetical protein [Kibdelosporangium philippinense]
MKRFPGGSIWRKWDLHVHPPGTKLSDGYGSPPNWDEFCRILEESDVAVFGITDYFSADAFYTFKKEHKHRYPESTKVFMPNVELRLNEAVNRGNEIVNIHILFRPDADEGDIRKFLGELKTQVTDQRDRNLKCSELITTQHFKEATVTRDDIAKAIEGTFGRKAVRSDHILIIVPANNDGIRAQNGIARKANIADQIDKLADALFGNSKSTTHFLKTDRFEDKRQRSAPKPVFSGCDAHSFEDLNNWLGKHINRPGSYKEVTWIKADPTFEGLQQTLVEPEHRVKIQSSKPDAKQPYQYISKVRFQGTNDFPDEITFNPNLVSIIGARSSGKSALIAYIAHAVDPDYTINQQVAASLIDDKKRMGPAAGKNWDAVRHIECSVEWGDTDAKTGKVIYIPQNSLYAISERPEHITAKIQPSLYRLDPSFAAAHRRTLADLRACNATIREAVTGWFELTTELQAAQAALRNLGDKHGVINTRDRLVAKIKVVRSASTLTEFEVSAYEKLVEDLASHDTRIRIIQGESRQLEPYLMLDDGKYIEVISATFTRSCRVRNA